MIPRTALLADLKWDSRICGCAETARISSTAAHRLNQCDATCRIRGIRLAYFLCAVDDLASAEAAVGVGFRLVEVRITFHARPVPVTGTLELRGHHSGDIPMLEAIAAKSHTESRFFADPRLLRNRCEELYRTWIRLDCEGRADQVFVVDNDDGTPVGYLTCTIERNTGEGRIGLVAVDSAYHGRGLGRVLVNESMTWFANHGTRLVRVTTQGQNVGAQRLYRAGFVTDSMELQFHKWYGPEFAKDG